MNLKEIYEAGHPATVIMAVINSDDLAAVEIIADGQVNAVDDVLRVSR